MEYSKLLLQYIDSFNEDELKVVQTTLEHYSLVPQAPQMLKETIMEMTEVIERFKEKKGNPKTVEMYEKWLKCISLAFTFCTDMAMIAQENILLKDSNNLNYQLYKNASSKLAKYQIIENEIIMNDLEKSVAIVKKKIAENGK